ncbi:ABC transporter substrate-binding protein [Falsiroseomonas selenitidurans]|uniref:ABC transporter substrate-binding protein n=1 Tax=Falsiroseomonas selenitidurans TaxID=2716335 RepID=A0ABX1E4Z2_9PROT|nr:ABC transporter substrate-binding protein [Falsiroseomonas selenitidurans]NKC32269.1 ABC transporter substrate-binding protein [Falsiroseomonas selenitidurans]
MLTRRGAFGAGLATAAILRSPALRAQGRSCRFTLDWAISGSTAFALAAVRNGYFRDEGIEVRMSRGFGSGRVPVDIAGGAHDIGFGDFSSMIRFTAENPANAMICVLMVYDGLPVAAVARRDGPIRVPKDLEGKRIGAPDGDAGRVLFPVFADAAGFDASKVEWVSVSPQLREPMLVRGQVDAITGFVSSAVLSLKGLGLAEDRQVIMRYRDFGVPLYSNCVMTTKRYAEQNPEIVRGVVRAIARGVQSMVRDPDNATQAVKEAEPLAEVGIEGQRVRLVNAEMILTEHSRRNGLSVVEPARLARNLDILEKVYALPRRPSQEEIYTTAFLPPAADLKLS